MNIQRFTAPTARDALAKARMAFGDGTLILSNRPTANGVEVVATAEDSLAALDQADTFTSRVKDQDALRPAPAPRRANPKNQVEDDVAELAMSTLSFQDYVRERMLRRRQEAASSKVAPPPATPEPASPIAVASPAAPRRLQIDTPAKPRASSPDRSPPAAASAPALSQGIVDELRNMKALIEERFDTLSWLGQARQHPIQSNLMLKLIRAGYSPILARAILEKMPEDTSAAEAVHWVMEVLERNLKTDAGGAAIHDEGGIFALIGATGVGKTTTAAKLAGLCARTHGPSSVGLITLDTYRVGAHEQLRAYGRMMGVVAHLAHDRAALQDLLTLLAAKKMVLIDTTGLSPHDPRKRDMLDLLDLPKVNRLQILNAGGHGDTLEDVVSSFKSKGVQQAVLSKIDEAAKLGPVLDAAIRHQLVLRGVTTGQRVPEDWEAADAGKLVRMSMRAPAKSAFDPVMADMGFFFAKSSGAAHTGGRLDA
ncbi:flagellar biosynthesis protein FlhF [Rhodoferax sp.]|uniref:flagellar biosynthesis protein FlhF n=1 Tax=Rhodoferax sp. TaxID=50421 RepID=UPI002771E87E|nr:flagellar biosynthesis protein FlhF [Rhodoferax sp.]